MAYVRADASPNEVLHYPVHPDSRLLSRPCAHDFRS